MTTKRPVSVNLSEENIEWIDAHHDSRSKFIDDLITDFREGAGDRRDLVAQVQRKQLEAKQKSLEAQLDAVDNAIQEVSQTVTTKEEHRQQVVNKAVETLGIPPEVGYDNPAAENWADKADLGVEEFWKRYTEAYDGN